jgi:hypothetical protein
MQFSSYFCCLWQELSFNQVPSDAELIYLLDVGFSLVEILPNGAYTVAAGNVDAGPYSRLACLDNGFLRIVVQ